MGIPTMNTLVKALLDGLGKNVLKGVLTASRYRVADCGKDCPVEKMIDAAEREAALAVSVSGLITTVIPQVRILRGRMAERGLGQIKVMAGGAALKLFVGRQLRMVELKERIKELEQDSTRKERC